MPEANEVIYVVENSVAWLRLNRPEQMNAMTNGLMQGISAGIDNVREDPSIRALVITGEGRGFCAGADLNQVAQGTSPAERTGKPAEETQVDYFNKALADLQNCPVPTIAKVNGPAAGGGLGLALSCDITIAGHSAFFVATFGPNLGIVPDMGTTWNLPRRVGRARSLSMALLGERVSAAQAEEWGLIWRAVPDADLDRETANAVAILKNSSPDASVRIRETIDAAMDNGFEQQLDLEMEHQAVLIPKNMKAGAKAFLEKRKPVFDGSRRG